MPSKADKLCRKENAMAKLIQDVTPVIDVPAYQRGFGQARQAKRLRSEVLITELWERGVTIETIFGNFYALEEMAGARDDEIFGNDEEGLHGAQAGLTVGDALLVAPPLPDKTPLGEMPF